MKVPVGTQNIAPIKGPAPAGQGIGKVDQTQSGPRFDEVLKGQLQNTQPGAINPVESGVKFSNHAVERMRSRGIQLGPEGMERLNMALQKAKAKSSKDTLVLMGDSAFIMNVKNGTVITAIDKALMKENVVTNIDSTIMV
jgi:flagellar operon protein